MTLAVPTAARTFDLSKATDHFRARLDFWTDPSDLADALESPHPPTVIDARSHLSYAKGHIPCAVSLPYGKIDKDATKGLPRNGPLVVYCDGLGCNAASKAAVRLLDLGFPVVELDGGLQEWQRQGHPVARA